MFAQLYQFAMLHPVIAIVVVGTFWVAVIRAALS
jgi:hypothetical protein